MYGIQYSSLTDAELARYATVYPGAGISYSEADIKDAHAFIKALASALEMHLDRTGTLGRPAYPEDRE